MARSHSDIPHPAQHYQGGAVNGPSIEPVFRDLTYFIDDILRYSKRVFEDLQELERWRVRDQLGRVQQLKCQVDGIKADLSDVQRSRFDGLRRLCRDRCPECIVLDFVHDLLCELNPIWRELSQISHEVLQDRDAIPQSESFQEFDEDIAEKIKKIVDEWERIPYHPDSPLCDSAAVMIEGKEIGSNTIADTNNHQERGILRQRQGLFQFWHCPNCPRTRKFWVPKKHMSLESAPIPPRVAGESFHKKVAWREIWCAKSHLTPGLGGKYACLLCLGEGKPLTAGSTSCSVFEKSEDLIKHIANTHNSSTLPKVFMQKLHLTKASEQGGGRRRDLVFLKE